MAVPSIVARQEAFFYSRDDHAVPKPIDLPTLIQRGKIVELAATAPQIVAVTQVFDRVFLEGLHDGEKEALALLHGGQCSLEFCTGDKMAIQALAMMDRAADGISLEAALSRVGLTQTLQPHFTEEYFKRHLQAGTERRIRGEGLRR